MLRTFIINQIYLTLLGLILLLVTYFYGQISFLQMELIDYKYDDELAFLLTLLGSVYLIIFPRLLYAYIAKNVETYDFQFHLIWNFRFFGVCFICLNPTSWVSVALVLIVGAYFLIDKFKQNS